MCKIILQRNTALHEEYIRRILQFKNKRETSRILQYENKNETNVFGSRFLPLSVYSETRSHYFPFSLVVIRWRGIKFGYKPSEA